MTTNLVLDPRQRAMLAEMGVRVWLPSEAKPIPSAPSAAALPQAKLDVASQPASSAVPVPVAVPVRREPPLRLPVLSSPPVAAGSAAVRYVIGNLPEGLVAPEAGNFDIVLLGEPCTGDAERLLASMVRALGAKTFVAQIVPSQNDAESLEEQLKRLSAKVIVALGPHSAKALLENGASALQATPFGKLRGMAHTLDGLTAKAVVTYHPLQLLRQPLAKAQTWLDLKLVLKELK